MAKDHYVMKSHLDKFVHPFSSRKVLYPYQKEIGLLRHKQAGVGPKGLGWAEDFYSQVLKDGTTTRALDEALRVSEHHFFGNARGGMSALARCIYDDSFFPTTEKERIDVAYCAAFAHCRAPVQIHNIAMLWQFCSLIAAINLFSPDDEVRVQSVMTRHNMPQTEAKAFLRTAQDHFFSGRLIPRVKGPERQVGFDIFSYERKLRTLIGDMGWRLLEAARGMFFLTSDNPVVCESPRGPQRKLPLPWREDMEVWYPLSYRYGLLASFRLPQQGRTVASRSMTMLLNRRMIKRAYRYVYSPLKADWVHQAVRDDDFNPLCDRVASLQDFCQAAPATNLGDLIAVLEAGKPADVFEGIALH